MDDEVDDDVDGVRRRLRWEDQWCAGTMAGARKVIGSRHEA